MVVGPRTVSFTSGLSDWDAEQRTIEQNRRLAEQLRQEAAQTVPAGSTAPGGYFVATSPLSHIASALKGVQSGILRNQADMESRDWAGRRSQALVEALKGMPRATTVTEDTSQEGTGSFDMSGTAGPATATVKPTMADNAAWLGRLSAVGPQALQIGSTVLGMQQKADEADENRAFRTTEAAANRAARLQERQMQIDFQMQNAQLSREQTAALARERAENARQLAQMQIESRLDLARFAAASKPEPQPQIVQTDQGIFERRRDGSLVRLTDPTTGDPLKPKSAGGQTHLTEAEAKGTVYHNQMTAAEQAISKIVPDFDVTKPGNQVSQRLARSDWTNWLAPDKAQQYQQAAEQWAESFLRVKTGAAATADEVKKNARTFFPQPGDKPEVIAQKNDMRRQAVRDVAIMAGRGVQQPGSLQSGQNNPGTLSNPSPQTNAITVNY